MMRAQQKPLQFTQGNNPKIIPGPAKGKSGKSPNKDQVGPQGPGKKQTMTTTHVPASAPQPPTPNGNPTPNPNIAPAPVNEDQVKNVKLDDIFADYSWNVRSRANVEDKTGDEAESTGFEGLMLGIATDGQDTPIVVRPTTSPDYGGAKTDKPFALVSGFRRFTAIKHLNAMVTTLSTVTQEKLKEEKETKREIIRRVAELHGLRLGPVPNTPSGHIRTSIRNLTDAQARMLNLRENLVRNNLEEPDLISGIADLKNNFGGTQMSVAQSLGRSQNYVSQYFRLCELPPAILKHWKTGGEFEGLKSSIQLDHRTMLRIHKLKDEDKQREAYRAELDARNPAETGAEEEGADRLWYDAAKKKIETYAELLARLQWIEMLTVDESFDWRAAIDAKADTLPSAMFHVGKANQEVLAKDYNSLARAGKAAFKAATDKLQAAEDAEAAAVDTEKEAAAGGKSGKGNKK